MSNNYRIEWVVTVCLLVAFVIHFWPIPWADVVAVTIKAVIAVLIMLALDFWK